MARRRHELLGWKQGVIFTQDPGHLICLVWACLAGRSLHRRKLQRVTLVQLASGRQKGPSAHSQQQHLRLEAGGSDTTAVNPRVPFGALCSCKLRYLLKLLTSLFGLVFLRWLGRSGELVCRSAFCSQQIKGHAEIRSVLFPSKTCGVSVV